MLKMIVTDMDGTLLGHDGITKENLDSIKDAQKEGTLLTIASGRTFESVKPLLDQYDLKALGILGNGAQFVDEVGNIIKDEYFPKSKLKEVIDILLEEKVSIMIFATNNRYYSVEDAHDVRYAYTYRTHLHFDKDFKDLLDDPTGPANLLVRKTLEELLDPSIDIIKVEGFSVHIQRVEKARERLKEVESISYLASCIDNVEITSIHAQKGYILEEVLKEMHINKEEVIVLGDGMNDKTLFELFPYSYAPSNATQPIKDMAYKVVSSCDESDMKDAIKDFQLTLDKEI